MRPTAAEWVEMDLRGNWASYREYVENAEERDWTYGETRTHTAANSIDDRDRDFDGPNGAGGGSGAPESFGTAYDLRGNLTGDAVHGYGYDEENRLTAVCRLDAQGEDCDTEVAELEIEYDALGRVVRRTVVIGQNERTFRYVYDGLSYAVIQEWEDGIGSGGAAGLLREFVYAGSHIEPVTMIDYTDSGYRSAGQAESLHYLRDERNCVVALINESGGVLESYRYDPYGRAYLWLGEPDGPPDRVWTDTAWTAATGSFRPNPLSPSYVGNPFGFTGHRFSAAGLFETPFRAYSPALGRWLQRDPIGYADGPNLLEYVASVPIQWLDPYGRAKGLLNILKETFGGVIVLGPKDAWDAAKGKDAQFAVAVSQGIAAEMGGDMSGIENATRHAAWQARLTQKYGEETAEVIGNLHESGEEDTLDSMADQHNNQVGRAIGIHAKTDEEIEKLIREALKGGDLITDIGTDEDGKPNDPRLPNRPESGPPQQPDCSDSSTSNDNDESPVS